jgi:fructose-bisphosphate aldolase class II
MYVSMAEMLDRANKENYAVMAINCFNLESAYATLQAAEESKSPIIIDLLMEHMQKHIPREILLPPIMFMAKKASVDVCINLDHGTSERYVKDSLAQGFLSVMIDASKYPFDKNVEITNRIVEFAHTKGATVEAEVGSMGAVAENQFTQESMYTDPEQAIRFIELTDVDALAISFGSSHGLMPKGFVPKFNFDIVRRIKKATHKPLVLHGGSGSGKTNIEKAVAAGINKINVGSDVMKAQAKSIQDQLFNDENKDFVAITTKAMQAAKEVIKKYIQLSGSCGKRN